MVIPASAYEPDLLQWFRAIFHTSFSVRGALKAQSTNWQRLKPWLHTASSPSPGYTNGLMSGFGCQSWPNTEFLCFLAMCCPPLSYRQLFKEERLWPWPELLCVTKPPGSDEGIQMATRVTSESCPSEKDFKATGNKRSEFIPSNLALWYTHSTPIFSSLITLPFFDDFPFVSPPIIKIFSGGFCFVFVLLRYQSETKQSKICPIVNLPEPLTRDKCSPADTTGCNRVAYWEIWLSLL